MAGDAFPEDWRWSTLGEVADPDSRAIVSGPFGSNIGSRFFVEQGVPVIRGNNLTTDMRRFLDGGFVFVTEDKADELGNCDAVVDDIVFTAAGSLGQVGIIPKTAKYPRYIISNKQLRARVDKRKVDPLFAFYWFSSKEMVEYVQQRNTGSSVPLINLSVLRSLPLPVPPLPEQRAIAHILGTLDDKIELNRRMNETLEAMARALFKSWFVDFDPVRAKAEGRDPGLPKEIADLFPDRFQDSELGEIPTGWTTGTILKQATLLSGGTPKTDRADYWDGGIPWASAKDVSQCGQAFLVATERTISAKGLEESATQLIPALSTVVVARGATTGRMVLFGRDMAMNQTCYALNSSTGTPFALHCRLRQEIGGLVHAAHGSVFDTITTTTFSASKVVVAPQLVVRAFEQQISPIFQQVLKSIEECVTLAALRDTLLPKLISGELRVKDAERFVGGVDCMSEVDSGRA